MIALTLVAVAACSGQDDVDEPTPSGSSADPAPAAAIAFVTTGDVRVAAPGAAPRRVAALPKGHTVDGLVWSADGRRLGWHEQGDASDNTVVLAEPRTGTVHRWRCQCRHVLFRGDDLVADSIEGATLTTYPADGGAGRPLPVTGLPAPAPTVPADRPWIDVVASTGAPDGLFIGYTPDGASQYGGPQKIYRLDADGDATPIFTSDANTAPRDGAVSADGTTLTYLATAHAGMCRNTDEVTEVNLSTLADETPDPPDSARPWYAISTWFDTRGQKWATLVEGPTSCVTQRDYHTERAVPRVFKAQDGLWVATGQRAKAGADLGEGRWVWLTAEVESTTLGARPVIPGTLSMTGADGKSTPIARDVLRFAVVPGPSDEGNA